MSTEASIYDPAGQIDNRVSEHAAESTFREVDDFQRATPAIEFQNVTIEFDNRKVLNNQRLDDTADDVVGVDAIAHRTRIHRRGQAVQERGNRPSTGDSHYVA